MQVKNTVTSWFLKQKLSSKFSSCTYQFQCSGLFTCNKAQDGYSKRQRWMETFYSTNSNQIKWLSSIPYWSSFSFHFLTDLFILLWRKLALNQCSIEWWSDIHVRLLHSSSQPSWKFKSKRITSQCSGKSHNFPSLQWLKFSHTSHT